VPSSRSSTRPAPAPARTTVPAGRSPGRTTASTSAASRTQ
jgi:hypothetical protein